MNPKASIAGDLGGDPDIGGKSVYDVGSLSLIIHIFIGGDITSESKPPPSDDVDVGTPDFCSDYHFFSNKFCDNLYADAFFDTVETLQNNLTLVTDTAVPTSGDDDEA